LLISSNDGSIEREEALRIRPDLLDEAIKKADIILQTNAPCGEKAVVELLKSPVLVFGIGDAARSPEFWKPYRSHLGALPYAAVEAAIHEYVGLPTSEFFPKPGPLKALAEKHNALVWKAVATVRIAQRLTRIVAEIQEKAA
jgi:hypothetical protein